MTLQVLAPTAADVNDLLLVPRGYSHPDARTLTTSLYQDQLERYGHAESPYCEAGLFDPPDGLFLVAYVDNDLVGCGGFRRHDANTVEIKRMYVRTVHRGHGYGARILSTLEQAATAIGAGRIILETGEANHAACRLYRRFGYDPIPGYSANRHSTVNRAFGRELPTMCTEAARTPRRR